MPVHHSANWLNLRLDQLAGRHADPAGGRRRVGGEDLGKDDVAMVLLRRRHLVDRRLPRRHELRRRVARRRASSSAATTAGRSRVPREKQTAAQDVRRPRRSATACPASASTATTSSRCSQVAREAVERARAGEGPTLIEALTYRVRGHSTLRRPDALPRPERARVVGASSDPLDALRALPASTRGLWTRGAARRELAEQLQRRDHATRSSAAEQARRRRRSRRCSTTSTRSCRGTCASSATDLLRAGRAPRTRTTH